MGRRWVCVLLLAAAGWARAAEREAWQLRPSFGRIMPRLSSLRGAVNDEREAMQAAGWTGEGIDAADFLSGPGGGVEVMWRPAGPLAYGVAFRASRVVASGSFAGTGVADGQTVRRGLQLEPMGGEAGATWIATESDAGSWVGIDIRMGVAMLVVSREGATEAGAARWYYWNRKITGTAPSVHLGLQAEWRGPQHPPLFVRAGYRVLKFSKPDGDFADSDGAKAKGSLKPLDFSGFEVEAGISFSLWPSSPSVASATDSVPAPATPEPAPPPAEPLTPSPSPSASAAP